MTILAVTAGYMLVRNLIVHDVVSLPRAWGVDFASYLQLSPLVVASLWLPLLVAVPAIATALSRVFLRSKRGTRPEYSVVSTIAIVVACATFAWVAPVAYGFLGDGSWYAAELYRSMSIPDYQNSMIKPSAWLTGVLLDRYAVVFRPENIRLPFVLAGMFGIVLATAVTSWSSRNWAAEQRLLVMTVMLGGAGTLVFFGYIELYAFVYGLGIAYLVTGLQAIRGEMHYAVPGVFLLAGIAFGAISVVWIPSYLLLLHWRFRGEGGRIPLRYAAVLLAVLPAVIVPLLYFFVGASSDSAYLVPVLPYERIVDGIRTGWQRYTLFEPLRFIDMLNAFLLALGPFAVSIGAVLVTLRGTGLWSKPTIGFGMTAAVGGLLLLMFGNTFLGLARDWDVAAFCFLGAAAFGVALFMEADNRRLIQLSKVLPFLSLAMISHLALWVALNADADASAERFEDIVMMDSELLLPMNTYTGWENLRKFHQTGIDRERYFDVLTRQLETGYSREDGYAEYLSSALMLDDSVLRETMLGRLMDMLVRDRDENPESDDFRYRSIQAQRELVTRVLLALRQVGLHAQADKYSAYFADRFNPWPEYSLVRLLQEGVSSIDEGMGILEAVVTDETGDAFLVMTAGGFAQSWGKFDKAAEYYERALEIEPRRYPSWYLVAADMHMKSRDDASRARELLRRCIREARGSREAMEAEQLLRELFD